jgi:hypothetical protein
LFRGFTSLYLQIMEAAHERGSPGQTKITFVEGTNSMKRTIILLGLSLMMMATVAFAQRMDRAERDVHIIQGPEITDVSGHSAVIRWRTDSDGANRVRYRVAGSNRPWQSVSHEGGGTKHELQLTGLEPGRTYEWQILTRDGDVRTGGQFEAGRGDRDRRHGDR